MIPLEAHLIIFKSTNVKKNTGISFLTGNKIIHDNRIFELMHRLLLRPRGSEVFWKRKKTLKLYPSCYSLDWS